MSPSVTACVRDWLVAPMADDESSRFDAVGALRESVSEALLYVHGRANANTAKVLEAASFLYALIEYGLSHLRAPAGAMSGLRLPR